MDVPLDDTAVEQYTRYLDNLEKTDPEGYKHFIATMESQLQAAGLESGSTSVAPQHDANTALFDMLKTSTNASKGAAGTNTTDFRPRFPGDKVMETNGLRDTPEGMYVDVYPGFVIKTFDVKSKKKVFVNVVFADQIQAFSEKIKLNEEGKEQDGIHIPLSLNAPHKVIDKKGVKSLTFDVAVNTKVRDECQADKTDAFRNFVCELAIEYIDHKYQIKLDNRYELSRLTYCGKLPPPKHYIRKEQTPIIQEMPATKATKKVGQEKSAQIATATYKIWEEHNGRRTICSRLPSVEKESLPLSYEELEQVGDRLIVDIQFINKIDATSDIELALHAELLSVKAADHHNLEIFLPYPVMLFSARVSFYQEDNTMEMILLMDKSWSTIEPDCGSDPWLLARALDKNTGSGKGHNGDECASTASFVEPKSLVEMFQLMNAAKSSDGRNGDKQTRDTCLLWDPVPKDDELPEDRLHRQDIMSMHLLEQQRFERELMANEAEAKRNQKRTEGDSTQKKAIHTDKTWHDIDSSELISTRMDIEAIVQQEKERLDRHHAKRQNKDFSIEKCVSTEEAMRAVMKWSESNTNSTLTLESALAFHLL